MEKSDKKRILTRVLIVIAALTLLSCCFLGSTFAKYVTNASGSGTVEIATWDVDISTEGSAFANIKISPSVTDTTHTSGLRKVATFKNSGDVDAVVTLTKHNLDVTSAESCKFTGGHLESPGYATYCSNDIINAMLGIKYYSEDSGTNEVTHQGTFTVGAGKTINIYAIVTWTTTSDAQDTWYGEWLESVTFQFDFSAVQGSELPTT